jgi:hypothetical protein
MKDYIKIFKQNEDINNYDELSQGAEDCLDRFGDCFE